MSTEELLLTTLMHRLAYKLKLYTQSGLKKLGSFVVSIGTTTRYLPVPRKGDGRTQTGRFNPRVKQLPRSESP
jgi:hypothetical protein